jgi:phytoene synthase
VSRAAPAMFRSADSAGTRATFTVAPPSSARYGIGPRAWERRLLDLAGAPDHASAPATLLPALDAQQRRLAFERCAAITARHSHTFYLATRLLPAHKRLAMHALYAFCRVTDSIVDSGRPGAACRLAAWRETLDNPEAAARDPVAVAWALTRAQYRIPVRYAEQLIEGVARDLYQTRYATFTDLTTYAYGVASTVGLMSMYILGFTGAQAVPYAVKLGVALQVTNILRDVAEDWRAGRIYLPADDLATFNLGEPDLSRGQVDARWRAFMRFQIARTRRLYAEAWPGIALLEADARPAVAAAAGLYQAILSAIERHDYDVFQYRAHLGRFEKLLRLPGIWRRVPHTWDPHGSL